MITGPPGYGKTLLARQLGAGLVREGWLVAHAETRHAATPARMLEALTGAVFAGIVIPAEQGWAQVTERLANLVARPEVRLSAEGWPRFRYPRMGPGQARASLLELIALADAVGVGAHRPVAIVVDELADVTAMVGEAEEAISAAAARARAVRIIGLGTAAQVGRCLDVMREWGDPVATAPLGFDATSAWFGVRLEAAGLVAAPGAIAHLVERAEGHPGALGKLVAEVLTAALSGGVVRRAVIDDSWQTVLERDEPRHLEIWRGLRPPAKAALAALAEEGRAPYASAYRERHHLGGVGAVQKALRALAERSLVWQPRPRDWKIIDPLLTAFVRDLGCR